MEKTWIVVADSTHARIFYACNRVQPLTPVTELSFPEARLREQDIYSDRPGRMFESASEARSAMELPDVREQQQIAFSRHIFDVLDKGRHKGKFEKLVLIAPPAMLGVLRHTLREQLSQRVELCIDKNLTDEPENKLRSYLFN
ncbi:hypothetical protein A167_03653 [Alcanivorax sp. S71-1-4]|uniref:host attachment protein n=1 Tax=Alcanivorax sp. S71-1-4 TaxID=1177159 RepID=UPI0013581BC0|nr:host attachment family protein [Alcanivorax sp. S71-1-4]KAF0804747.1 hypothetical protein A167_03653 [Alcanivorax sp. S71-1-4]